MSSLNNMQMSVQDGPVEEFGLDIISTHHGCQTGCVYSCKWSPSWSTNTNVAAVRPSDLEVVVVKEEKWCPSGFGFLGRASRSYTDLLQCILQYIVQPILFTTSTAHKESASLLVTVECYLSGRGKMISNVICMERLFGVYLICKKATCALTVSTTTTSAHSLSSTQYIKMQKDADGFYTAAEEGASARVSY